MLQIIVIYNKSGTMFPNYSSADHRQGLRGKAWNKWTITMESQKHKLI